MTESKLKNTSPFVQTVLKLDSHFSDLIRLGGRIESLDMKSDFDFDQAERLIKNFAKSGEGVSEEILLMVNELNELRAKAESAAQLVAVRADLLQARKEEQQKKMEDFRQLGEKVRELTSSLSTFKSPEGESLSDEEREKLSMHLAEFESRLRPLIEEAQTLKKEGQNSKMKTLEQSADSLEQSLSAVSQKLSAVRDSHP